MNHVADDHAIQDQMRRNDAMPPNPIVCPLCSEETDEPLIAFYNSEQQKTEVGCVNCRKYVKEKYT